MSVSDDPTTRVDRPLVPLHCVRFPEPGPPRLTSLPNGTPLWLVTRHHDVRQVLTDPRFTRSLLYVPDAPPLTDTPTMADDPDLMFNQDGPDHARLRRTVQQAFTPRAIECWRPWVVSVVERLLDDLVEIGPPADVIATFTQPLPIAVISRLMGLDDVARDRLRSWSSHAFTDGSHSPQEMATVLRDFTRFSTELLAERRREPGDDLVSGLVRVADEEGGIPEEQLVSLVGGLVVGGLDTTITALGNAMVYLLGEKPEHWSRLGRDEAAAEMAIERLLFIPLGDPEGPPGSTRRAAVDIVVGGVTIPAGSVVAAHRIIANWDPEVFPGGPLSELFAPPEGQSLAFGAGPHNCLGAWLARMQLQLAVHLLAARLPGLRLAEPMGAIDWRRSSNTRSPRRLPVLW
jgi:cytochrome P450